MGMNFIPIHELNKKGDVNMKHMLSNGTWASDIKDFEDGKIQTKELYLSLVINYIANITKKTIEVYDMNFHYDHYWSFGTPYDLEHYNYDRNIWDA